MQQFNFINFTPPPYKSRLTSEVVKQIIEETPLSLPKGEKLSQLSYVQKTASENIKPGYVTANPLTYESIKEIRDYLKDNPTETEKIMWQYLRRKKTGHKIRRQHIIDNFITDFLIVTLCVPSQTNIIIYADYQ